MIYELPHVLANVDGYAKGGAVSALTVDPVADVAVVVGDDYHGAGIGTELLHRLVSLARQMKVRQMVA